MINARERKAKKKAEVEAAQARVDEQEQAHEDALEARNIAHSPTNTEKDVPATGKTEAKTEVEADTTSERSEVQEEDEQPERQQTAEVKKEVGSGVVDVGILGSTFVFHRGARMEHRSTMPGGSWETRLLNDSKPGI